MLETSLSRGELVALVVLGVTLGNLVTLFLIVGWRAFLFGRPPTFRSAPVWAYLAVVVGSLFPILALLGLLDAALTAVLE